MRRFVRSYLAVSLFVMLLVNLILILLYGRSFQAANENCPRPDSTECLQAIGHDFSLGLLVINIATIGLLVLGFAIALTVKDTTYPNRPKR